MINVDRDVYIYLSTNESINIWVDMKSKLIKGFRIDMTWLLAYKSLLLYLARGNSWSQKNATFCN